ncbi:Uma2 family endonuclease [Methylobacter sp.]|uniref:Uma2 family endonuclease n=1 Tax=Methylobacter sp. TaxID=2051955 RepID=UPI001222D826|nr:Uma2 family endonuclease [Methylobacter sp.]TAK65179.1 MAG: Uma2 family endonuclease [Methylobacter sp.]
MNLKHKIEHLPIRDYLEGELISSIKHEYINGEVHAMTWASSNHNRLMVNIVREFGVHLKNTPCEAFGSDMKVQVEDNYFYPDVMVVCQHEANDYGVTDAPLIIVEVLSKSTRKFDHTLKRQAYQRLSSLLEYVVIEQDVVDIEVCRRSHHWQPEHFYLGDEVYFAAIDLRLPVTEIYDRVANEDVQRYWQTVQENAG